jgi:truncated hemoglobin YjbI
MLSGMDRALQRAYGKAGGLTTRARHDGRTITAAARQAFEARFYRGLDDVPEPERTRRAAAARAAYFARLTAQSMAAAQRRRQGTGTE